MTLCGRREVQAKGNAGGNDSEMTLRHADTQVPAGGPSGTEICPCSTFSVPFETGQKATVLSRVTRDVWSAYGRLELSPVRRGGRYVPCDTGQRRSFLSRFKGDVWPASSTQVLSLLQTSPPLIRKLPQLLDTVSRTRHLQSGGTRESGLDAPLTPVPCLYLLLPPRVTWVTRGVLQGCRADWTEIR